MGARYRVPAWRFLHKLFESRSSRPSRRAIEHATGFNLNLHRDLKIFGALRELRTPAGIIRRTRATTSRRKGTPVACVPAGTFPDTRPATQLVRSASMIEILAGSISLVVGFALGYAVRAHKSRRRRPSYY